MSSTNPVFTHSTGCAAKTMDNYSSSQDLLKVNNGFKIGAELHYIYIRKAELMYCAAK